VDASYSEDNHVYRALLDRLRQKYENAREFMPRPVISNGAGTGDGVISFGSSYEPTREALDRLREGGRPLDHLLLRALPVNGDVREFLAGHERVFLVEQNRDGQLTQILRDEYPQFAARLHPVLIYDGLPATAGEIVNLIEQGGSR
jgi:2-oxoglutarate ferredoxin oxidoreductase subunit alpha